MTDYDEMKIVLEETIEENIQREKQLRFLIDLLENEGESLSKDIEEIDYDEKISNLSSIEPYPSEEGLLELYDFGCTEGMIQRTYFIINELKVILGDKVRIKKNNGIRYEDVK